MGGGIGWSFVDAKTGADLAAVPLSGGTSESLQFSVPAGCDL
jgi:hypothetical protein